MVKVDQKINVQMPKQNKPDNVGLTEKLFSGCVNTIYLEKP
jgi:hypothetical protein